MKVFLSLVTFFGSLLVTAQPITGIWRGKITNGKGMFANTCKVELKLIKNGDSLVGTAYYYSNTNNYIRYSVKGFFDKKDNAVHWRDDKLVGVKPVGGTKVGVYTAAMNSDADFNCPGNNVMELDGKSQIGVDGPEFVLHYDKIAVEKTYFPDEWDNVIEGYFTGMDDPDIIDSVFAISKEYVPDLPEDVVAKADDQRRGRRNRNDKSPEPAEQTTASNPGKASIPGSGTVAAPPPSTAKATMPGNNSNTQPSTINTGSPVEAKQAGDKPGVSQETSKTETGLQSPGNNPNAGIPKSDSSAGGGGQVIVQSSPPVNKPGNDPPARIVKKEEPKRVKTEPPVTLQTSTAGSDRTVSVKTQPGEKASVPQDVAKVESTTGSRVGTQPVLNSSRPAPIVIKPSAIPERIDPVAVQKFETRRKIEQGEIPMVGDTVELNFYDNAEVDGDSIALFLNGKLLFNHVLLSAQAYTFKLAVKDLPSGSELTMVAENLGSIPPNTAYMMAVVDGQRYSARLESTEQTSGVIKLVRR